MFSKITFLKSVHSKERDEACLGFLVNIFTKSVHRGGVEPVRYVELQGVDWATIAKVILFQKVEVSKHQISPS